MTDSGFSDDVPRGIAQFGIDASGRKCVTLTVPGGLTVYVNDVEFEPATKHDHDWSRCPVCDNELTWVGHCKPCGMVSGELPRPFPGMPTIPADALTGVCSQLEWDAEVQREIGNTKLADNMESVVAFLRILTP